MMFHVPTDEMSCYFALSIRDADDKGWYSFSDVLDVLKAKRTLASLLISQFAPRLASWRLRRLSFTFADCFNFLNYNLIVQRVNFVLRPYTYFCKHWTWAK